MRAKIPHPGFLLLSAWGLLVTLYFWGALSQPVLMAERDLSSFFFPAIKNWMEAVQNGEFPFWNPYSYGGQPLLASLQPGILYPPNAVLLFLPLVLGFNLTIILHFYLSGWFVYLLARELGGSSRAGMIAALGFSLGGFLLSLHSMLSSLQSAAWAPLVLCFFLRMLKQTSIKYGLLTLGAILVQFLGGGVEIFLLTQALVVLTAFFPQSLLSGRKWPGWTWRLKALVSIYLLFIGLGAVQIFPFWEMVRQSSRGQGFSYEQATIWSLSWRELGHLFFPDIFWRGMGHYFEDQNWLKSIYLGFIPLFLLWFFFRYDDRKRLWWAGLLLVPLLLALGRNTPVYEVLYRTVPGIPLIRYPVKFFFLTNLFICLLAGFGWDVLEKKLVRKGPSEWSGMKRIFLLLGLALGLLLLGGTLFYPSILYYLNGAFPAAQKGQWPLHLQNLFRFGVVTLLTSMVIVFLSDRKLTPVWGGRGLIFLLAADLFLGNWGFYRVFDGAAYFRTSPNLEIVKEEKAPFRVYTHPRVLEAMVPGQEREWMFSDFHQERFYLDYPAVQHLENAFGFPVLVFKPFKDLLVLLETSPTPQATDILRLMNVKYLLWPDPVKDPNYRLVRRMPTHHYPRKGGGFDPNRPETLETGNPHLYEIQHVLPRAALVPEFRVAKSERERGDLIKSRGFDPVRTALLEETPVFPGKTAAAGPGWKDEIELVRRQRNGLDLKAVCAGRRLLVISEVDYPGWRVWVDGKPEKIYRANHAFRAVPLDPGIHSVRFAYKPQSFYGGLLISLTTLFGISAYSIRRYRKRPFPPEEAKP